MGLRRVVALLAGTLRRKPQPGGQQARWSQPLPAVVGDEAIAEAQRERLRQLHEFKAREPFLRPAQQPPPDQATKVRAANDALEPLRALQTSDIFAAPEVVGVALRIIDDLLQGLTRGRTPAQVAADLLDASDIMASDARLDRLRNEVDMLQGIEGMDRLHGVEVMFGMPQPAGGVACGHTWLTLGGLLDRERRMVSEAEGERTAG